LNVLLVEDDEFKAKNLAEFVEDIFLESDIDIAASLVQAIDYVNKKKYDFLFVDMAIPSHPIVSGGGAPMSFLTGGLEVLLELSSMDRDDACFIVTQYPEIELAGEFYPVDRAGKAIKEQLGYDVLGCVEFSEDTDYWKDQIKMALKKNEYIDS